MNISRRWFSVSASGNAAEVSIFSEIGGWGVNATDFKKELDAVKDKPEITLLVNSLGGDAFLGMALFSMLKPLQAKLTVKVLGVAASIASIVALAGRRLVMAEGSFFMIHNPSAVTAGNAADIRKTADLLDQVAGQMAGLYSKASGKSQREVLRLMAAETWFTAEEAVEAGFADEVDSSSSAIAALGDLSKFKYKHAPQAILERSMTSKNPPATPRDLERLLRDAGYSRSTAAGITSKGFTAITRAGGAGNTGSGNELGERATSPSNETVDAERARGTRLRMLRLLENK